MADCIASTRAGCPAQCRLARGRCPLSERLHARTPAIFVGVKLYSFDGVDAALDLLPLAARRALAGAGRKVSLEAWRALPLETRRVIVEAGSAPTVDAARVEGALG